MGELAHSADAISLTLFFAHWGCWTVADNVERVIREAEGLHVYFGMEEAPDFVAAKVAIRNSIARNDWLQQAYYSEYGLDPARSDSMDAVWSLANRIRGTAPPTVYLRTAHSVAIWGARHYPFQAAELSTFTRLLTDIDQFALDTAVRGKLRRVTEAVTSTLELARRVVPAYLPPVEAVSNAYDIGPVSAFRDATDLVASFVGGAAGADATAAARQQYEWHVSRLLRNRLMHALNGNGDEKEALVDLTPPTDRTKTAGASTARPPSQRAQTRQRRIGPRLTAGARWLCWWALAQGVSPVSGAQVGPQQQLSEVTIISANVTSLEAHWGDVCGLEWDPALIQEARLPTDSWVYQDAQRKGIRLVAGHKSADGKPLLCALVRTGTCGRIAAGLGTTRQDYSSSSGTRAVRVAGGSPIYTEKLMAVSRPSTELRRW